VLKSVGWWFQAKRAVAGLVAVLSSVRNTGLGSEGWGESLCVRDSRVRLLIVFTSEKGTREQKPPLYSRRTSLRIPGVLSLESGRHAVMSAGFKREVFISASRSRTSGHFTKNLEAQGMKLDRPCTKALQLGIAIVFIKEPIPGLVAKAAPASTQARGFNIQNSSGACDEASAWCAPTQR
jgi:hypothetical protein